MITQAKTPADFPKFIVDIGDHGAHPLHPGLAQLHDLGALLVEAGLHLLGLGPGLLQLLPVLHDVGDGLRRDLLDLLQLRLAFLE